MHKEDLIYQFRKIHGEEARQLGLSILRPFEVEEIKRLAQLEALDRVKDIKTSPEELQKPSWLRIKLNKLLSIFR